MNAMAERFSRGGRTVAVVGGGFSGSLFALKLSTARPDWKILLVEEALHPGRGLAYGACAPHHLLNVPVHRMEVGLEPRFSDWLRQRPGLLAEALDESRGTLADAYVSRQLFGDYVQQLTGEALRRGDLHLVQSKAVAVAPGSRRLHLADGRVIPVDDLVLATGHQSSSLPFKAKLSRRVIGDPWAPGLNGIPSHATVLLVGSGLTMVDTILSLRAQGHTGILHAVARHGLLPRAHKDGGVWPSFLDIGASPVEALQAVRAAVRRAKGQGIPWQRVFDSIRPLVAALWHGWTIGQRAQFLRHLRTLWDVHRHRMAARIAATIDRLLAEGRLKITAGHILALDEHKDGLTLLLRPRGAKAYALDVDVVINCTGPRMDLRNSRHPFLQDLLARGLVRSDPLGLGLDTEDSAVKDAAGTVSGWIYALGPLTRPAWWEIVAVPEINAQIDRLVERLSSARAATAPLHTVFVDMGAGI
ncbi:MAG TPA: FAD/NAD(P)-binding protein [Rhizomicrobium sp.]|nr:FAD/NAD(P)-binding protein [Rhizomicrobium sp.]